MLGRTLMRTPFVCTLSSATDAGFSTTFTALRVWSQGLTSLGMRNTWRHRIGSTARGFLAGSTRVRVHDVASVVRKRVHCVRNDGSAMTQSQPSIQTRCHSEDEESKTEVTCSAMSDHEQTRRQNSPLAPHCSRT